MEKNKPFLILLLFLSGGLFSNVSAQKYLDSWMKKCENIQSVDITVINYKNPETKKEEQKTIKVSFTNNSALMKELIEAFRKDKENAYQVSEKRVNGETRPDYCRFQANKTETRYMFEYKKTGEIIVTMQILYNYIEQGG